jgi:DNA-binding transcriptional LysR family regulator
MLEQVTDMLVFVAVARAGSVTRAGRALGLPKSTISRRLAALERHLGHRLLTRSARHLVLTEIGEALLERCQRLSEEAESALTFAGDLFDPPRGTLRVTMPPDLGLWEDFADFAEKYPSLSLVLDESARFVDIILERFDVALRTGPLADSSLVARPLPMEREGVFASPAYLARHPGPSEPAQLADHDFIVLEGRRRYDQIELERGRDHARVSLRGHVVVSSSAALRHFALRGIGMIVTMPSRIADELEQSRLVRVLPDWSTQLYPTWIVTPSRRLLPRKTTLFIEHLAARGTRQAASR